MSLMIILAIGLGYSLAAWAMATFAAYRLRPQNVSECLTCSALGLIWPAVMVVIIYRLSEDR